LNFYVTDNSISTLINTPVVVLSNLVIIFYLFTRVLAVIIVWVQGQRLTAVVYVGEITLPVSCRKSKVATSTMPSMVCASIGV